MHQRQQSTTWRTIVSFIRTLTTLMCVSLLSITIHLRWQWMCTIISQGNKGAFLSPLVSVCLAVHLKKTINNVIQYGNPVGALAIATVVVGWSLLLIPFLNSLLYLAWVGAQLDQIWLNRTRRKWHQWWYHWHCHEETQNQSICRIYGCSMGCKNSWIGSINHPPWWQQVENYPSSGRWEDGLDWCQWGWCGGRCQWQGIWSLCIDWNLVSPSITFSQILELICWQNLNYVTTYSWIYFIYTSRSRH